MLPGKIACSLRLSALALSALAFSALPGQAQLTGFVSNPTTNSSDFSAFVASMGGVINANVNFDSHPVGVLQSTYYLGSDGVTLTGTSGMSTIASDAGPGQGNTSNPPLSSGEGAHASSGYLVGGSPFFTGQSEALTISFLNPVSAVGLFTLDYFGPAIYDNSLTITGYSGANGTGANLGSFSSERYNFQANNLYFMGLATADGSNGIGSLVFSRLSDNTGDVLGIDNIQFARMSGASAVPEPGSIALLVGMGVTGAAFLRRRKLAK